MSENKSKEIHIVFQVLNFLHDSSSNQYPLLAIDKLILITLASHKGKKGIFPAQETIANELKITERHLRKRIKHLVNIKLIVVQKIGRNHHYTLEFLSTYRNHSSAINEKIPEPQFRSHRNYSSANTGTTVPPINKLSNKLNNSEGARARRAHPLPDDFLYNYESVQVAKRAGLTQEEGLYEFEKFLAHYRGNGALKVNWQSVLQEWFLKAGEFKKKNSPSENSEPHSRVPWFNPAHASAHESAPVADLLNGLVHKAREKMNGNGETTNGMGQSEVGMVPKKV